MERQIKFRAKVAHYDIMMNPEDGWVYGFYYQDLCGVYMTHFIKSGEMVWRVNPETIGQFTGMLDKNGKDIYEGDIVRYYDDIEDELVSSHVIYHKESCSFCAAPTELCGDYIGICAHWQFEVIGNIFDNSGLLSKKQ